MIDRVTLSTIDALGERSDGPWISICVPTDRLGPSKASKIRLENLLAEAKATLAERDTPHRVMVEIERQGENVLTDPAVWTKRSLSLAVFISPDAHQTYRMDEVCESSVVVADRPDVDQLRSSAERNRPYALLALSLDHVRLMRGDHHELVEDDPPVVPSSLAATLVDLDREPQLQSHSAGRGGVRGVSAAFHGQEVDDQPDVDRFLRSVAHAVTATIGADLPLVLAGTDRIVADFRRVSDHHALIDQAISGNNDDTAPATLHRMAWPIVDRPAADADRN